MFNSRLLLTFSNPTYEQHYTDYTYIGLKCKSIFCLILLALMGTLTIIHLYQHPVSDLPEYYFCITFVLLGVNGAVIIFLIIFFKVPRVHEAFGIFAYAFSGFYCHIFIGANIDIGVKSEHNYIISLVIICVNVLNMSRVAFVFLIVKGFRNNLLTICLGFTSDILFIFSTFNAYHNLLFCYLITNSLTHMSLLVYDFLMEIKTRSLYYAYKELEKTLKSYYCLIYNCKNPYFSFNNMDSSIQYLNRSSNRLCSFLDKQIDNQENTNIVPSVANSPKFDSFCLSNFSYYKMLMDNHISVEQHKVDDDKQLKVIEELLNQLTYVNEELQLELYDYLLEVKNGKFVFNLQSFSKIAIECYGSQCNVYSEVNNTIHYSHMNNTQTAMLFKKCSTINGTRTLPGHKTSISSKNKMYAYTLLGKVGVKFDKNKDKIFYKEYYIYFDIVNEYVYFTIEDFNTIIAKERKDTVQICRNMYISKISHEFKNPLCNIFEVMSLLNDDIKNGNSSGMLQNLSILTNIFEMMSLLIKDFSFYSKMLGDEEDTYNRKCSLKSLQNIESIMQSSRFKQFSYRESVFEIIELFTNKAKIDKRDQKVSINFEIDEGIPDGVDSEKEAFISLLFNLMFHCYKAITFGQIRLRITQPHDSDYLKFKITSKGSISHKNDIVKNNELLNSSIESKKSKNSDQTYLVENYHIQNLFSISDPNQRNAIIDEFNNNFNIYISQFYAKQLGYRLNMKVRKDRLTISVKVKGVHMPTTLYHNNTLGIKSNIRFDDNDSQKNDDIFSLDTIRKDFNIIYDHLKMENFLNSDRLLSISQPLVKKVHTPETKSRSIINTNLKAQTLRRISYTLFNTQKETIYRNNENRIVQSFIKHDITKLRRKSSAKLLTFDKELLKPNLRVLLVDDEVLIRKCLARYFNKFGNENNMIIDICEAENGFECIEHLYKYYQENKLFDLIIIDETMPIVRGTIVIEMIKNIIFDAKMDNIIIVSYTSYDSVEKKEYILSKGADFIITKPIRYEEFVQVIEKIINK
jgi:CheY-like chemotaxis protein